MGTTTSGYGGYGIGPDGSLFLANPQLAQALRTQRMAQPFMQEGTSGEPIRSKWQGVNRLAQALLGGYLYTQGNQQIQTAIDQQNAQMGDFNAAVQRALTGGGQAQPMAPQDTGGGQPQASGAGPDVPKDYTGLVNDTADANHIP